MFKGSIVALVTPFLNGEVDEKKLENLVEFHIANGTHAIVSCGTTGESATLSHAEDEFVTKKIVEIVNKRVPVLAGSGSNNYTEALSLTQNAKDCGADAALVVTPYYNKPTQEGMYQHFTALAKDVKIPIVLYNVPGRTGVSLTPETTIRLAQVPNIIAIKDATGSMTFCMDLYAKLKESNKEFTILSGDDALTMPMMAMGAKGVISVAANIIPKEISELTEAMLAGDYEKARKIHYKYLYLMDALFYESNPIPVKAALNMMGLISDEIRLPLLKMSEPHREKLKNIMTKLGLIA